MVSAAITAFTTGASSGNSSLVKPTSSTIKVTVLSEEDEDLMAAIEGV